MSKQYHCGVNRFTPRWVRRILSTHFNSACFVHDVNYGAGMDLKRADKVFLANMRIIAGKNPVLRAQAIVYYVAVRIFSKYKTWKTTKQR
jgi:hypothetical protein